LPSFRPIGHPQECANSISLDELARVDPTDARSKLAQQVYDRDRTRRGGAACAAPAEAIMVVPAGSPARLRRSRQKDTLYSHLEQGLVAQVAVEAVVRNLARLTAPPLDGLD
jgi:hypothetical protein